MTPEAAMDKKKSEMAPIYLEGQNLGKYRLLEPLGRGGMAQVYKAYHPQLDRYVAIKILRSDLVEEVEFLARFRREARAVAALRHPNIVQIYDFDAQDDLYYMVMELLEGDTLKAYLNGIRVRGEYLPLAETIRIFTDVLNGLSYAHSEGIIHRDLKPANIMLTKRGQAVLTDFGIAQIIGGTQYTVSGALMGTLSYMAPEQGMDGHCDARSDIYSLGVAYYETLTGTVPFDADTPLAILMKHINDPLPMPRKYNPDIPESFERVALKALEKNADDRFQSAETMSEALMNAANEAGIQIPTTITLPLPSANSPSHPGAVAVFSGSARQQIQDASFASGDTDITTGMNKNLNQPPTGTSKLIAKAKTIITPPADLTEIHPHKVRRAVLSAITGIVIANMLMLWLSGIFGWKVFGHVWPMELVVVGILLIALMIALPSPWLLIPGGIVLGNGFLFSYFALSGKWQDWTFFWPLEPLLLAVCIISPFLLNHQGVNGLWLTRRLGNFLLILSVIVFIVSVSIGIIAK
jgi:serine/threonine protein kinase